MSPPHGFKTRTDAFQSARGTLDDGRRQITLGLAQDGHPVVQHEQIAVGAIAAAPLDDVDQNAGRRFVVPLVREDGDGQFGVAGIMLGYFSVDCGVDA